MCSGLNSSLPVLYIPASFAGLQGFMRTLPAAAAHLCFDHVYKALDSHPRRKKVTKEMRVFFWGVACCSHHAAAETLDCSSLGYRNRARGRVLAEHLDGAGVRTVSGDMRSLVHDRVQLVNRLALKRF